MGRIERVPPKDAAGTDNTDRRFHFLHCADLYRGCVGPEEQMLRDVERIAGVPRWMAWRNVQRVEVIVRGFDLRSVLYGVTHRNEDVFDFFPDNGERMTMTNTAPVSGQCNVQRFTLQGVVFFACGDRRLQCLQRPFYSDLHLVGDTSEFRPLIFRKFPETLKLESENPRLAGKITGPEVF